MEIIFGKFFIVVVLARASAYYEDDGNILPDTPSVNQLSDNADTLRNILYPARRNLNVTRTGASDNTNYGEVVHQLDDFVKQLKLFALSLKYKPMTTQHNIYYTAKGMPTAQLNVPPPTSYAELSSNSIDNTIENKLDSVSADFYDDSPLQSSLAVIPLKHIYDYNVNVQKNQDLEDNIPLSVQQEISQILTSFSDNRGQNYEQSKGNDAYAYINSYNVPSNGQDVNSQYTYGNVPQNAGESETYFLDGDSKADAQNVNYGGNGYSNPYTVNVNGLDPITHTVNAQIGKATGLKNRYTSGNTWPRAADGTNTGLNYLQNYIKNKYGVKKNKEKIKAHAGIDNLMLDIGKYNNLYNGGDVSDSVERPIIGTFTDGYQIISSNAKYPNNYYDSQNYDYESGLNGNDWIYTIKPDVQFTFQSNLDDNCNNKCPACNCLSRYCRPVLGSGSKAFLCYF